MINAFVITLSKNPKKFFQFKQRFDAIFKDQPITLNRFEGVNGSLLTHDKLKSMGYDTLRSWRDPYHNRKLTGGELGNTLSHIGLWQKCIELNDPIIILEDDVEFYDNFSLEDIHEVLKENEFVFLARKEIQNTPQRISEKLVRPSFSYWAAGYAITPSAAKKLYNKELFENLIPSDEYIPLILGINPNKLLNSHFKTLEKIEPLAFDPVFCSPTFDAYDMSDTEIGKAGGASYLVDFKTHVFTVASEEHRAKKLLDSSKYNKINVNVLGKDVEWKGGTMAGPGGGMKINLLREAIQNVDDNDVILFVDGYDVFINDNLESIVDQYLRFHKKVVFAAEKTCWPNVELADQFSQTKHKNNFLNSGCFMGVASEIKRMLSDAIDDADDDQLYYQKAFLSRSYDVCLDHNCRLFQCVAADEDIIAVTDEAKVYNEQTDTFPKIIHGNGGEYSKEKFDHTYHLVFQPILQSVHRFVCDGKYKVIGPDILLMKFMTKEMCDDIIALAELTAKRIGFQPLPDDQYPGQEIRINKMDRELYYAIEDNLQKYVYPAIEEYWNPMKMFGIRDLFIIRYSQDTQKSLNLHNDISYVSGSVKLNNDYAGAELYFPRQGLKNTDIEVGDLILWPSQVTHPHESLPIVSGTKYSIVLWTKRFARDDY